MTFALNRADTGSYYLDHSSSAWPKAPGVSVAMQQALEGFGSPLRGSHSLALAGAETVKSVRNQVAELVGASDSDRVIFAPSATYALNFAIRGLHLGRGDHVVATCYDHNSVLRNLGQLRLDREVLVTTVKCRSAGEKLFGCIRDALRPNTRLLTINCASNVNGAILPYTELVELAHANNTVVLLDASQTIGHLPIDLRTLPADLVAFGGHKGLLGPPGVGCLVVGNSELELVPSLTGGTGHNSEQLDPRSIYPLAFEVGTANVPAIAGLGAAIEFIQGTNQQDLVAKTKSLQLECLKLLNSIPRVTVHTDEKCSIPIVSFNVEGTLPERVSAALDVDFGIQTRSGLHCAPIAHEALRTGKNGSVRVSFGYKNSEDSSSYLYHALKRILD